MHIECKTAALLQITRNVIYRGDKGLEVLNMTGWMKQIAAASLVLIAASPILAQESTNNVATKTDWSVFKEDEPKECWAVSSPKETVNTRDGVPTEARRGDILLFVTFRSATDTGELSFSGGYPFAGGSTVKLEVGTTVFELLTDGEWAWSANVQDDATILAAMKNGASAKVTGRSGRGTQTEDTFSLLGFTAAMEEAAKQCK